MGRPCGRPKLLLVAEYFRVTGWSNLKFRTVSAGTLTCLLRGRTWVPAQPSRSSHGLTQTKRLVGDLLSVCIHAEELNVAYVGPGWILPGRTL
jgi:hypothetical protein